MRSTFAPVRPDRARVTTAEGGTLQLPPDTVERVLWLSATKAVRRALQPDGGVGPLYPRPRPAPTAAHTAAEGAALMATLSPYQIRRDVAAEWEQLRAANAHADTAIAHLQQHPPQYHHHQHHQQPLPPPHLHHPPHPHHPHQMPPPGWSPHPGQINPAGHPPALGFQQPQQPVPQPQQSFKYGRVGEFGHSAPLAFGTHVIVEGDRGRAGVDLGMVTDARPYGPADAARGETRPRAEEAEHWRNGLAEKERSAKARCQEILAKHGASQMRIVHAEFQFDLRKLTFHFMSKDGRPNFRGALNECYSVWNAVAVAVAAAAATAADSVSAG
eukprot:gene12080-20438_t